MSAAKRRDGKVLALLLTAAALLAAAVPQGARAAEGAGAKVRVGCEQDFKPYAFVDANGQPAGFSVDLIRAVADTMGLPITIAPSTWDAAWNGLVSGKIDVLPVVAKMPSRIRQVDFSLPHTETFDAFFVPAGSPFLKDIRSAKGKEIVVLRSDAAHHALLERNFEGTVVPVDTTAEMFALIASGKHDALLYPKVIGTLEIKERRLGGVLSAGPPIPDYKRVFSFAVKKGDAELLEKLNQGLMIVKTNGEYDRIYEKWLTADDPWRKYRDYAGPVAAIAAGLILAAVVWVTLLRRLVRKRTRELDEKNEMLRLAGQALEERITQRTAELLRANAELQAEIAERKWAEDALKKIHDGLEARVQERTKELNQAGESLKTERQRFFDVLEMLPAYVVLLSPDYHVPFANRFFRERFGESCGKRCFEYLFDRTEPCEVCETYTVLKTNAPHHWEWTGPDNRNYDIFDFPFKDTDGSPLIMEVGIDITERMQAEKALREINETLEQRVAERTAELHSANAGLQDSRRAALNLMEDSVAARRRAEVAAVELRREVEERKLAEEALQRAREELELRVQERTEELRMTVDSLQDEINERVEAEDRIRFTNALLRLFTETSARKEYLDSAMDLIRGWSGCSHIGIRVADMNGNIPYESCAGFSSEFLESENMLSLTRDHCACTRVVAGTPEPQDMAAMTPDGSFYSNNSMKFVEGLTDEQKARFRGICIRSGFTSVAVVPIRYRDRVLGAIHLADEREGMVPLRNVEFLEQMAFSVGEAIFRFGVEEDLRKNYAALRNASALLERIFSTTHMLVAYLDRDFNFIRVNRAYAEADGHEPDYYAGKNHFALFPNEENLGIFRQVVETGEPYFAFERAFEYAEHPERGVTYWDWSLLPVKEEQGSVSGLVFTLINVTDRKRAEEEKARLASAVESTAEAVVITDVSGAIQYVNTAFEQITGYSRNEVLGRDLHIVDSGKHGEAFYREIREALQRDGVWRGRLINRKKDGTFYYEEGTYSPVKGPSGEIINYVSVKRDVTEKLRLESIAESVNLMDNIGYVFSGVRHEIGNPINSAKMILSVLRYKLDQLAKESVGEYVDRALTEIGRVEHLLKSLKYFNLYETPELQTVGMPSFLEKFLKLVREDFEKKGVRITAEVRPGAEQGRADPRALQQVLLNIVTNAADALEGKERPAIGIAVMSRGGSLLIRVTDNGAGMTDEQQRELFKPFYTSKKSGTGLGLVIVKKMLTRMNGDIAITSRRNEGTTVDITIPEGGHEPRQEEDAPGY